MLDMHEVDRLIAEGTVKATRHPSLSLTIYNYTAACQYDRRWCDVSKVCRGLILADDGSVVARPFPKFFNMEEHSRSEIAYSKPFRVTEKLDGSLGVLYPADDGWAIATRGSFTSEQAERATRILRTAYAGFSPLPGLTYLFEIIYPQNRIVVDYGTREDLVLLTVIDTATGRDVDDPSGWPGPCAATFDVSCHPRDVMDSLNLTDDGNSEGVVLRFDWPKTGPQFRVKVKLAEYKRLHRLLTMTSSKTIWEALSLGQDLTDLAERVPDEFHQWLRDTIAEFQGKHAEIDRSVREEFAAVRSIVGDGDRKAFAQEAVKRDSRAFLFKLLDGHPIDEMIWRQLKPEYSRPFRGQDESVA